MTNSSATQNRLIGMIGGSGLYDMDGLSNTQWIRLESSFGEASDELLFGDINGQQIVFLPRHGRGHPGGDHCDADPPTPPHVRHSFEQ